MRMTNVCLILSADEEGNCSPQTFEKNYEAVFRPLLTFLYSHPKFPLAVSFSGLQLEWYASKHPEAIQVMRDLTSRKQVEVLGGGYYSPIFPILFPVDRSGQIEKMTSLLRSTVGKRPCGISLYGSIWDPTLVTTFQSCGMEYALLDSTLIPAKNLCAHPLITSEQGKTLKILPTYKNLIPEEDESPEFWIERINNFAKKKRSQTEFFDSEKVVSICFSFEKFASFVNSRCFAYIASCFDISMESTSGVNFVLPQTVAKNSDYFERTYIPAGMDWQIARRAVTPFETVENKSRFPLTIHDYLNAYPQNRRLYQRMMYISMLVTQCKGGDKMRKLSASEKLWEAQSGFNFVTMPCGIPPTEQKVQESYRALNEAERLIRDAKEFKESLTSFDYNGDGKNEYICQMEKYHAVISLNAGQITEFDIIRSCANYAANLSRIAKFDGSNDLYQRGMFIEHLIEPSEIENFKSSGTSSGLLFSNMHFSEKKFDSKRNEIQMESRGEFSSIKLPVQLRKNYIAFSSGITIQYILKNESYMELDAYFVVELNFAKTKFSSLKSASQYSVELIHGENREQVPESGIFSAADGVSFFQITDNSDKKTFVVEPNEDSGLCTREIVFYRPDEYEKTTESSRTMCVSLYWHVQLAPGMEKEKTINLSVVQTKKKN